MEIITAINQLEPLLRRIESFEDVLPSDSKRRELARVDYQRFASEFKREFALHIESLIEHKMPAEAITMSARFASKLIHRAVAQKPIALALGDLLSPGDDPPEDYLNFLRLLCKYNASLLGLPAKKRKKNRPALNWLSDLVKYKLKPLRKLVLAGTDAELLARIATNEQIECVRHFSSYPAWQLQPALDLIESTGRYTCARYKLVFAILSLWDDETAKNLAEKLSAAARLCNKQPESLFVQQILFLLDDERCDANFINNLCLYLDRMAIRQNNFEEAGRSGDNRLVVRSLWFFWKHCDRTKFPEFANLLFEHEKWFPKSLNTFARSMSHRHRMVRLCTILTKNNPNAARDLLKKIHSLSIRVTSVQNLEPALSTLQKMEDLFDTFIWGLQTEQNATIETIVRLSTAVSFLKIAPSRFQDLVQDQLRTSESLQTSSTWSQLVGIHSTLDEAINKYRAACSVSGVPDKVPVSVAAVRLLRTRYINEIAYLEQRLNTEACQIKRQHLGKRLDSLRSRASAEQIHSIKSIRKAVKVLTQHTHKLHLQAVRSVTAAECCRKLGFSDEQIADPRIVDAAFLLGQLLADDYEYDNPEHNAPLLLKVLKSIASGTPDVRAEFTGNKSFIADLQRRNISAERWQSPFELTFASEQFAGGHVRIYVESNPLEILQMGTRFNTCLSIFGAYFGQVVANVVDYNKKVLYAKDGDGRIVGRKLIALSQDFQLLGFPVYSLEKSEQSTQLKQFFKDYGASFAAYTEIELAEEGKVKSLHGCSDYIDDPVPWTKPEPKG